MSFSYTKTNTEFTIFPKNEEEKSVYDIDVARNEINEILKKKNTLIDEVNKQLLEDNEKEIKVNNNNSISIISKLKFTKRLSEEEIRLITITFCNLYGFKNIKVNIPEVMMNGNNNDCFYTYRIELELPKEEAGE